MVSLVAAPVQATGGTWAGVKCDTHREREKMLTKQGGIIVVESLWLSRCPFVNNNKKKLQKCLFEFMWKGKNKCSL